MSTAPILHAMRPGLQRLALLAAGRTGADIERLMRELRAAVRRRNTPMEWRDVEAALAARDSAPVAAALLRRVAIHEAGHAIAYTVLDIGVVQTVSINSAHGGETAIRLEIADLQDEKGLGRMMTCLLAGRVAEKLMIGDVSAGSGGAEHSDLARATRLAFDAETTLGLSPELPLLYRPPTHAGNMLLLNAALADRVHARLQAAEARAVELLVQHRAALEAMAQRLIDRIALDGEEVKQIILDTLSAETVDRATENAIPISG